MNNPLLIPFGTAPFEQIKNDHFKPAFLKALKDAKEEIKSISENPEPPTFENTLVALDFAGQHLDRISSLFFNLNSAETNDEIQKIAQEVSPLLSEFNNDIILNEALFQRIKTVFEQREGLQLSEEQKTLLNKRYKSFSRNGANLNEEDKSRLREIDKKLAQLNLKFGENVLAETNKFEMLLTEEDQLSGLPEGVKEAAAQL
ncbi:MAG: M3 family peptidase, partial [Bacteroidota bacterium]